MPEGTVKWFNEKKGYGFISPDDGPPEVFVHYTVIQGEGYKGLKQGQRVKFEATEHVKGWQAVEVARL